MTTAKPHHTHGEVKLWRRLSRHTIFHHSRYLTVEEHQIELPDGRVLHDWAWVTTPDFVIIAARTECGSFLCFRQTKYAIDGVTLAVPGGYIEPGEQPLAAARRELLEETGYEASDWTDLGHYVVDGNRGSGTAHLFLARGARPVAAPDADDLEEQELLELTPEQVRAALVAGEFRALPWSAALGLALLHA